MARRTRKRFDENQQPRDARGVYNESSRNMLFMEDVYPNVIALPSHAFRLANQEESEPTKAPIVKWNAFTRQLERKDVTTSRKIVINVEFEIECPPWTHSRVIEAANAGVQPDFLLFRDATEYKDRKVELYTPSTPLKEPLRTENLKMGGLDPQSELVGKTTGATCPNVVEIWGARGEKVLEYTGSLYAVCFANPDYDGVRDEGPGDILIGGQGGGPTFEVIFEAGTSENSQYDSSSAIPTGIPDGMMITSQVQVGSLTFFAVADDTDPSAGSDGGVYVYDGSTVSVVYEDGIFAIGLPFYGIAYDDENQRIIAVGGGGIIYTISRVNPLIASNKSDNSINGDYVSIAVSRGTGYIAASNGTAYTFTGAAVTEITSEVVGSIAPSELNRVAYLGNEHIAFGGASGFFSESDDGGETWRPSQLNGGVGNVRAIAGQSWRIFASVDDTFFERSALSLQAGDQIDDTLKWRQFVLEGDVALSGDIRDIAMLTWMSGPNVFVAVTDGGELIYIRAAVSSR